MENMPHLLVSVRSASEALIALYSGAGLIDVKEPSRGPLGFSDVRVVEEVLEAVGGAAPVSVALGEIDEGTVERWSGIPEGVRYAKLGLAGCARYHDWPARWAKALRRWPDRVARVAVVYADWRSAGSPRPEEIVEAAGGIGCAAVLVDTFDKARGALFDHFTEEGLQRFVQAVRQRGMLVVLAGSLDGETIPRVKPLQPDYVAVRGAACRGGRSGTVDPDLVGRLASLLE
jgi:uncharacterized protein (UPF0264 family)